MDLAIGAKRVFVIMSLCAKDGTAKLVPACTYPLTGLRCMNRVYTEHGIFDLDTHGDSEPRIARLSHLNRPADRQIQAGNRGQLAPHYTVNRSALAQRKRKSST
ncbi:hypothetical protein HNP02_007410 [Mycobacterium sp. AZCC_0083]|nr:hypothetical protein [Mycobacterium sp. AZCC_0083]